MTERQTAGRRTGGRPTAGRRVPARAGDRLHVEGALSHSPSAKNDATFRSERYRRTPTCCTDGCELAYEVAADTGFAFAGVVEFTTRKRG